MKFVLSLLAAGLLSSFSASARENKIPCSGAVLVSQEISLMELDSNSQNAPPQRDVQAAAAALNRHGYKSVVAKQSSIGGNADEFGNEDINLEKNRAGQMVPLHGVSITYTGKTAAKAAAIAKSAPAYRVTAASYLIPDTNNSELYAVVMEKGQCNPPEEDGDQFTVDCDASVVAIGPKLSASTERELNHMSIDGMHHETESVTEFASGSPMEEFIASVGSCGR